MLVRSCAVVLLVMGTGCAGRDAEPAGAAGPPIAGLDARRGIALVAPDPLFVGGTELNGSLPLAIVRQGYQGGVEITLEGLPPELRMRGVDILHHESAATLWAHSESLPQTIHATVRATPATKEVASVTAPIRVDVGSVPHTSFGGFDLRAPDAKSWFTTTQHGRPVSLTTDTHDHAVLLTRSCELGLYDAATDAPVVTFGEHGVARISGLAYCDRKPVALPGGAFLVRGSVSSYAGPERLARVTASGGIDVTFGRAGHLGLADGALVALGAAGEMVVASGTQARRFDGNGHVAATGAIVLPWAAEAIAIAPDGAVLAVHTGEDTTTCRPLSVFRTNAYGAPDETFAPGGLLDLGCNDLGPFHAIEERPDGAIVLETWVMEDALSHQLAIRTLTRRADGAWSVQSSSAPDDLQRYREPRGTELLVSAYGSLNTVTYDFERRALVGGVLAKATLMVPRGMPSLVGFAPGPSHGLVASSIDEEPVLVRIRLD
jgi:hypothetical protein